MKIRVGLLGLPNVGKSSCFNALAQQSLAQAANFPFCTIDPTVAPIAILPDRYLSDLGRLAHSRRTVPATIDWIDVAGLARNAHRGEGLGNQFLGTLRECHALCHLIRVFGNDGPNVNQNNVAHVEGMVDPVVDAEIVHMELLLADLEHVQRRLDRTANECQGMERNVLLRIGEALERGLPAKFLNLSHDEIFSVKSMGLLTLKPVLYAFNVDEVDFTLGRKEADKRVQSILQSISHCDPETDTYALVSAKMEAELAESFETKEQQIHHFNNVLGMDLVSEHDLEDLLSHHVLPNKIKQLLNLAVAYTGPGVPPERSQTTRAHLFAPSLGWTAHDLAGKLHGDIQKGFIRAEIVSAPLLLENSSYLAAKDAGCIRTEGKHYCLASNDVILVKWK